MYNNQKIGVGIITCNREQQFRQLFDKVLHNSCVDSLIVVKNKEFSYHENDPLNLTGPYLSQLNCTHALVDIYYRNVKEDVGVGYCKNVALKYLMQCNCDHLFLIEDDIDIKDDNVFKVYIDTAKAYKLQHLNFCMAWDSITKKYLYPAYSINNKNNVKISIFNRLCGDFEYFTKEVIQQVGLFDAKHYINALEHAEHTYRIAIDGYTTPFYAFADIYKSTDYLEDTGIESSIQHDAELYNKRVQLAAMQFAKKYGRTIGQIERPSPEQVQKFLIENTNEQA